MYIVDFFDHKQSNYHLVMEVVGYKDRVNVTYICFTFVHYIFRTTATVKWRLYDLIDGVFSTKNISGKVFVHKQSVVPLSATLCLDFIKNSRRRKKILQCVNVKICKREMVESQYFSTRNTVVQHQK